MLSHHDCILIIDDAPKNVQLEEYFAKFNYQIIYYDNLDQMNESVQPAALLINCSLIDPGLRAIDLLYHRYSVPLIVISEQKNEEICVKMLEAGADDFLIKPIHPRELHARLGAIGRRVQRSIKDVEQDKEVLVFANWKLYPGSRRLFDESYQELVLSAGEYDLLLAFVRQPQQILCREFLLQVTKSSDLNPFDRRIDVQISRLRQKIETDTKRPALIKTIRNGGYLFTSSVISLKENNEITE